MTDRAQRLIDETLSLPAAERDLVICELLARLDGQTDPDAERKWAQEIERRAAEARAGAPSAGTWNEVCDEIDGDLDRR